MPVVNGYCSREELVAYLVSEPALKTAQIDDAINAASRGIDGFCGGKRRFWPDTSATARLFRPLNPCKVPIDDALEIISVEVDERANGTFTLWAVSDYETIPYNGIGPTGEPWPVEALEAVGAGTFPSWARRSTVRVTAKWGWPAGPPPSIHQASLQLAARYKRRSGSPEGIEGVNDIVGIIRVLSTDPDVGRLVEPYRHWSQY